MPAGNEQGQSWEESLCCPECHHPLEWGDDLRCRSCGARYPFVATADGRRVPWFRPGGLPSGSVDDGELPFGLASMPDRDTVLSRVRSVIGAGYIPKRLGWERRRQELLSLRGPDTRILEIGAGGRRVAPAAVTLDLFPFPNTDIVADAAALPLSSGSFDCVWLECVLEHCPDPSRVAAEAWRVTAPGGAVLVHTPWMLFYHDYPGDYWRFSVEALRTLFPPEAEVETGVVYGPATALVSLLAEFWPRVFTDSDRMWPYAVLRTLGLLFLFPLKYLDFFLIRSPAAYRMASTLYAIARKPPA